MTDNTTYGDLTVTGQIYTPSFSSALGSFADSFRRLRISNPLTLFFDSYLGWSPDDYAWFLEASQGTITFDPTSSSIDFGISLTNGNVWRQSKMYIPYLPGKSSMAILTGVLCSVRSPTSGVTARIGIFDDGATNASLDSRYLGGDGHFFQLSGSTLAVVQRRRNGSSYTDTVIALSSWNVDKLDGTGASGINLDPTKANAFIIERLWSGVGSIKFGIFYNNVPVWCHVINNENMNTSTYMLFASLPVRFQLNKTAGTASLVTMKLICSTVVSEGGYVPRGRIFAIATPDSNPAASNQWNSAILLRLKLNGIRGILEPIAVSAVNIGTSDLEYRLTLNPTLFSTPTWLDVNTTYSFAEYNNSTVNITTLGMVVASGYIAAAGLMKDLLTANGNNILRALATPYGVADIICVAVRSTNNVQFKLSLQFLEIH